MRKEIKNKNPMIYANSIEEALKTYDPKKDKTKQSPLRKATKKEIEILSSSIDKSSKHKSD